MAAAALKDSLQSLSGTGAGPLVLWSVALVLVCLLGDLLCSAVSQSPLLWRALADNGAHGAVGVAAWAVVVMPPALLWSWSSLDRWGQCLLCGVLASLIDLDHFWQAGALDLKAAVSLQHRPPFHSTSLVFAVAALLWVVSLVLRLSQLKRVALMCLVAWLSHHLRDAWRRGLWFPPFGSTPPLPYVAYVAGTVVLCVLVHFGYSIYCQVPSSAEERIVEVVPQAL